MTEQAPPPQTPPFLALTSSVAMCKPTLSVQGAGLTSGDQQMFQDRDGLRIHAFVEHWTR